MAPFSLPCAIPQYKAHDRLNAADGSGRRRNGKSKTRTELVAETVQSLQLELLLVIEKNAFYKECKWQKNKGEPRE